MKLNPKIAWGLAWAGLALVIAVPSADMMTAGFGAGGKKAILTSDVETETPVVSRPAAETTTPAATGTGSRAPVLTETTASEVTTTRTANGVIITPAGGKLPAAADTKALPAPTQQVAAVETPAPATKIVPTPLESWLRPVGQPAPAAAPVVTTPPAPVAQQPALVIDELQVAATPVPPDPIVDDTQNWEEESLREFLERRGILEGGTRSSATVTQTTNGSTYDPDGFYLDEGPNGGPPMTAEERFWMLFEQDPDSFTVF